MLQIENAFNLPRPLKPEFMIVGYGGQKNILRYFPFENGKIGAELPFKISTAKNLFSFYNDKRDLPKLKGLIPDNLLYFNPEEGCYIWTIKAGKKFLRFNTQENLLQDGFYFLPKLVFKFDKGSLSVFAVKKGDLKEDSKLFNAPFLNVYSSGNVCMGNVSLQHSFSYVEDIINMLENSFFNSVFTHTIQNEIIKGNLSDYMNKVVNNNIPFDENLLLDAKLKLKNLFV